MISIPFIFFSLSTLPFWAIVAVFLFVDLLHIFQTGTLSVISFIATILALGIFTAILFATWYFLQNVDWQQTLTIWNSDWLRSVFRLPVN